MDVPGDDPVVNGVDDLIPGWLGSLEVGLHHGVVGLDDGFDQVLVSSVYEFGHLIGEVYQRSL